MHTPGPWTYDESTNEIFSLTEEHGSGWIAVIGGNDSNNVPYAEETKTANARLISAAPELLDGLRQIAHKQKTGEGNFSVAELCHSLIARAEGGSQ